MIIQVQTKEHLNLISASIKCLVGLCLGADTSILGDSGSLLLLPTQWRHPGAHYLESHLRKAILHKITYFLWSYFIRLWPPPYHPHFLSGKKGQLWFPLFHQGTTGVQRRYKGGWSNTKGWSMDPPGLLWWLQQSNFSWEDSHTRLYGFSCWASRIIPCKDCETDHCFTHCCDIHNYGGWWCWWWFQPVAAALKRPIWCWLSPSD